MGRLIAAVVALAVFVMGAMHWSQAEQLQTMPQQPLCPGVTYPSMELTALDPSEPAAECAAKADCASACADKSACGPQATTATANSGAAKSGCAGKTKGTCGAGKCADKLDPAVDA